MRNEHNSGIIPRQSTSVAATSFPGSLILPPPKEEEARKGHPQNVRLQFALVFKYGNPNTCKVA